MTAILGQRADSELAKTVGIQMELDRPIPVRVNSLPAIGTASVSRPIDYVRHLVLPAVHPRVYARDADANSIRSARGFGLRDRLISKYALKNIVIRTIAGLGLSP